MKTTQEHLHQITALADLNTTVKELWEKSGKSFSNSHVYYIVRKHGLPFKRALKTKPFKHLKALQSLNTANMTIKQIMVKLGLSSRNDYHTIMATLKKNGLRFKQSKSSGIELKLIGMDTKEMTIDQIAKALGIIKLWKTNKLYKILRRLEKQYKSRKPTTK